MATTQLDMGKYYCDRVAHWITTDSQEMFKEHNGDLGVIFSQLPEPERQELIQYMRLQVSKSPVDKQYRLWFAYFGESMPGSVPSLEQQCYQAVGIRTVTDANGITSPVFTFADLKDILGQMSWAWPGWLPNGMLSMLVGEQGEGKSILALRLAACFLRGDCWPDGTPYTGEQGCVLWVETEAGQALNLNRVIAWGLPSDKILLPLGDLLDDVNLTDDTQQATIVARANLPDVRLIIVDSLSGGNSRDENSSVSLKAIKWLGELARDTGKPVLVVHHLRKKSFLDGPGVKDLDRVRGHGILTQLARVVMALDRPDRDSETKRLSLLKCNLGRKPEPLGMTIGDAGVSFDADAPEEPHEETQADRARDLLLSILDSGPVPQSDVEQEFKGAGISEATMNRAKKSLGAVAKKNGRVWYWGLPAKEGEKV